ncbi:MULTISPECIES: hypothetical protein [Streptomyces]|uniref:hypothetical protein n=1 Tax=Streptomyces TaxID=1883 RepID=UPI0036AD9146
MTNRDYEVGDTVLVPWGLDLVEGTVVGAYGEGSSLRVLVEVDVGDGATEVLPFSSRALEIAQTPEEKGPPGAWVHASRYEDALSRTLTQILRQHLVEWHGAVELRTGFKEDRGIDIRAQLPDRVLVVEAKHYSDENVPLRISVLDQIVAYLREPQRECPHVVGLVVTNTKVLPRIFEHAQELRESGIPLWVAMWRPWETSPRELEHVVAQALDSPVPE